MSTHTVSCPFRLTNPAPFEAATSSRANHVHASTGSFRWCSAFRTWLGCDLDDNFWGFIPPGVSNTSRINRIFAAVGAVDRRRLGKTFSDVIALTAVLAKDKLQNEITRKRRRNENHLTHPASVLAMNSCADFINNYSHSAIRLWTQNSTRLQHIFFSRKSLISLVLIACQ